jgi:histidine triad (HIT) family protein
MAYDSNNIFAKILRGEIPCEKVYESEYALAFKDIKPQAPVHTLVIPKGAYVDYSDFSSNASDAEILDYIRAIGIVAKDAGITENGYRILSNIGDEGGQEVPHLHVHVFGGQRLGRMIKPFNT